MGKLKPKLNIDTTMEAAKTDAITAFFIFPECFITNIPPFKILYRSGKRLFQKIKWKFEGMNCCVAKHLGS